MKTDDGAPLPKLSPEWLAMIMMDITAHLMAALDKAAAPLDRIANAAEDAIAHLEHSTRRLLKKSASAEYPQVLLGIMGVRANGNHQAIRLGGVEYHLDKKSFEARLATARPEAIGTYSVEIEGREFPIKQAVSLGLGAPRGSFRAEAAIRALILLGYMPKEKLD
jgi:hypothetical protein